MRTLTSVIPRVERIRAAQEVLYWARRFRAFLGKGWIIERSPIVVSSDDELCLNPIFILGTHRSGTSLVRRVLDSHPRVACPPETFFLSHFSALINDPTSFDGFANLGFSREEALKGLRVGASFFHEAYRRAKGKPRWADKTPTYTSHLDTLETLFGPLCQFIVVFSQPLDRAVSIWKRGWTLWDAEKATGDPLADTCTYVADCARLQLDFLQKHQERCFVIYYDRLVAEPEVLLRSLCVFLQEPWAEEMLRHHAQPHDAGTEDPVVRGIRGFSVSAANWLAWAESDRIRAWRIVEEVGTTLGYGPADPRRAPAASDATSLGRQ